MQRRVVIFDLDDTLIVESATARRSLEDAAECLIDGLDPVTTADVVLRRAREAWHAGPFHPICVALGFASWEGLWSTFDGCHPLVDDLRAWAPQYREEAWRLALTDLGVYGPQLAAQMADAYVERQRRGHPLIEGAAKAVDVMAGMATLGLLTNGPADIQRRKLAATGLGHHFATVTISGECGLGKPNPAAFSRVLEELGVAPARAVMVGDSWERDVVGALETGMSVVWISDGRPAPEAGPGVTIVDSVADLPLVLSG